MESMRKGGSDQAGSGGVSRLPREALDGVMRAWLEILTDRHPEVTWIIGDETAAARHSPSDRVEKPIAISKSSGRAREPRDRLRPLGISRLK